LFNYGDFAPIREALLKEGFEEIPMDEPIEETIYIMSQLSPACKTLQHANCQNISCVQLWYSIFVPMAISSWFARFEKFGLDALGS